MNKKKSGEMVKRGGNSKRNSRRGRVFLPHYVFFDCVVGVVYIKRNGFLSL